MPRRARPRRPRRRAGPLRPASKGPDPTGAATGTAADVPVKDAANPTLAEVMETVGHNKISINFVWVLITGFLVMFMQTGFAMVETGFTRAKNAAHTFSMNYMVYPIGMFGYWVCGFALQMGGVAPMAALGGVAPLNHEVGITLFGKTFELFGARGFFLGGDVYDVGVFALFLFQMVFMDTAVTIPTGAMAERWKWSSFLVYGLFMSMIVYPLFGNWVWGGGWLADLGANFGLGHGHVDFAGLVGRAHGGRRRRPRGRDRARAAPRQVRQERQADRDPRPPHPDGARRHADPRLRLVRLQPGLDARRHRPAHRRRRHEHDARRHRRRHHRHALHDVEVREARPQHDVQRPAGRPRGDHRALRVRDRAGRRC